MSTTQTESTGPTEQGSVLKGPRRGGPPLGRIRGTIDAVTRVMAMLSVTCIVVMLLATVADVVRRYLWGTSIHGVTEMGEVAMVAIVFLGLGYAQSRDAHVSMTLVVRRMRPESAALVNGLGLLLVTAMVGWLLLVTSERAIASYQVSEYRFGLVQIPIWPARIAIAVGVTAYLLELLFALYDDIRVAQATGTRTQPGLIHRIPTTCGGSDGADSRGRGGTRRAPGPARGRRLGRHLLLTSGAVGLLLIDGLETAGSVVAATSYSAVAKGSLIVVPMFVLMGMLTLYSGIAEQLFAIASRLLRWLPGSLGISTVFASAGFGAISGSSLATVATLGRTCIIEMMRHGYQRAFASATVAASGTLAVLTPPASSWCCTA